MQGPRWFALSLKMNLQLNCIRFLKVGIYDTLKPGNYKVLDLCLPNFFGNSAEVNAPFADVKSAFHNSISKG